MRRLAGCALLVLLTACSLAPAPRLSELTDFPEVVELADVPFYRQQKHHCGPASLKSQLEAAGVIVDYDSLVRWVYVPGLEGSLQVELLAAARALGRIAYRLPPDVAAVLGEVEAGRPVLVLLNLGLAGAPVWHYALVVGFDPVENRLLMHSGQRAWRRVRASTWQRQWQRGGRWAMVLLAPGEWPAEADRERLLGALAAFEEVATPAAAGLAWGAVAERWPAEPIAWLGLGNSAYRRGDRAAAAEAFETALRSDPSSLPARMNLALTLADSGSPCDARRVLGSPPSAAHRLTVAFGELERRLQSECRTQ